MELSIFKLPREDGRSHKIMMDWSFEEYKIVSVIDNGRKDDTYYFTECQRGVGVFNGLLLGAG
jgi:hypothetical protein